MITPNVKGFSRQSSSATICETLAATTVTPRKRWEFDATEARRSRQRQPRRVESSTRIVTVSRNSGRVLNVRYI
jgi:hypothetical protein